MSVKKTLLFSLGLRHGLSDDPIVGKVGVLLKFAEGGTQRFTKSRVITIPCDAFLATFYAFSDLAQSRAEPLYCAPHPSPEGVWRHVQPGIAADACVTTALFTLTQARPSSSAASRAFSSCAIASRCSFALPIVPER